MKKSKEVFTHLKDIENITEEDKHFLRVISKKVIELVEAAKGKTAKTRIRLDEDSDQEYELVRKRKREPSTSNTVDPETKWYNSIRYYCKKVPVVIRNGDPYIATLTKHQKKTLINDSELLSQNLLNFIAELKEDRTEVTPIISIQFTMKPLFHKAKTTSI